MSRHQQGLPPTQPQDLLALAALQTAPEWQGTLAYETRLPIGSGMGASAAFLLSTLNALREEWRMLDLYDRAVSLEHLQHGTSSGLDVWASLNGGCWWVQGNSRQEIEALPLPEFQLYHTGTPEATTGECVDQVRKSYPAEHGIWEAFEQVAVETQAALLNGEPEQWNRAIRENEELLHTIGVVPEAVHAALSRIETAGGAGKVCGAGSIRGEGGGIVLVRNAPPELIPPTWTAIDAVPQSVGTQ
jgi:hydroxymethylglutaryl-CoA synthase